MKILIDVKFSKQSKPIEKLKSGVYIVMTNKKPKNNKANEDIIMQLAKYFRISKLNVSIVAGRASKHKAVEILMPKK